MRRWIAALIALAAPVAAFAVTPAQEKAFIDAYRAAFVAKDAAKLTSLLYAKGADPMVLEFYKAMLTDGMGSTIDAIALEPLSDADRADAMKSKPGPNGKSYRLPLAPVRKLVVKRSSKSASGSSTSSSTVNVAEFEGRLVIPVPVAVP